MSTGSQILEEAKCVCPKCETEPTEAMGDDSFDIQISIDGWLHEKKQEVVRAVLHQMQKHDKQFASMIPGSKKKWSIKDMGGDTVGAVAKFTAHARHMIPVDATVAVILPDKPRARLEVEIVTKGKGDYKAKAHDIKEKIRVPIDQSPYTVAEFIMNHIYEKISGYKR